MTERWWTAHTPVETVVECCGDSHRVRWYEGRLEALDHDDPEGERTLAALGGTSCACVELLDAWSRHTDDLRLLTLASRGPGDVLTEAQQAGGQRTVLGSRVVTAPGMHPASGLSTYPSSRMRGMTRRRPLQVPGASGVTWFASAPMSTSPMSTPAGWPSSGDDLSILFGASSSLWDRLVATIIAEWSERMAMGDERCGQATAALAAALSGRAVLAVRRWLGDPDAEVVVEMVRPDEAPGLVDKDGPLIARLPFQWLRDLWSPGLTVLLGRFCLALVESEERRQRVLTVSKELLDAEIVTITVGD